MKKILSEMLAFSYLPALCCACATVGMIASFTTEYFGFLMTVIYTVLAVMVFWRLKRRSK